MDLPFPCLGFTDAVHVNPELLGLGRQIGQISSGAFEVTISTHFGTVSPLSMFTVIQSLFLQKTKPLYPHPKYLFEIGICSPWAKAFFKA